MNSTSVNSSKTSKEVKQKKEVKSKQNNLRVVGGPLSVIENNKEYSIEMNPEYIVDIASPMMDLVKSVGTYSIVVENGKIIKRVDDKTGFVLDAKSIDKAIMKNKSKAKQTGKTTKTNTKLNTDR